MLLLEEHYIFENLDFGRRIGKVFQSSYSIATNDKKIPTEQKLEVRFSMRRQPNRHKANKTAPLWFFVALSSDHHIEISAVENV